jgi:FAD/FMN-containing dehydrogenase
MATLDVSRSSQVALDDAAVAALRASVRGQLLLPGADGYDAARSVWNAMIDRKPALIVRAAGAADVIAAVNYARDTGLPVSIKGGGHNVGGKAVCDDGLMIDLSLMKGIRVDPARHTVRAQGGVTWGELDHETGAFGLATTGGFVPTTGIAGLTLGGGLGFLMRSFGLACDNLVSADIVTAEGRLLTGSAIDNADLFWGLRGGGGNFGVVTSFEFQLRPVGPALLAGFIFHPLSEAGKAMRFFREFTANAPDALQAYCVLLSSPDGHPCLAFIVCYNGPLEAAESAVAPLRAFGQPLEDTIAPLPYPVIQQFGEPVYPHGRLNYWKSSLLDELSDEIIDNLVEQFASVPSPLSLLAIEHMGGAIVRVPEDETAFSDRHAKFSLVITSNWTDPADNDRNIQWARAVYDAVQPFSSGAFYVNYLDREEDARVSSAYGAATYQRLQALKKEYDPTNLFRVNYNIPPSD